MHNMLKLMRKQNPTLHNQDAAPEVLGGDLVDSDIHEPYIGGVS